MGRVRFVKPETRRLDLSDGDWIDVKKHLNVAERAQVDGAGVPGFRNDAKGGQAFELDFTALKIARAFVYITGWSFQDAKGNQTKPTRENVENLDEDSLKEIDEALDAHVAAMDAEKKGQASAPAGETS